MRELTDYFFNTFTLGYMLILAVLLGYRSVKKYRLLKGLLPVGEDANRYIRSHKEALILMQEHEQRIEKAKQQGKDTTELIRYRPVFSEYIGNFISFETRRHMGAAAKLFPKPKERRQ